MRRELGFAGFVRENMPALLRTAYLARKAGGPGAAKDLGTLDVWDSHLARHGAELLAGRLDLVTALAPHVAKAYDAVAEGRSQVLMEYRREVGRRALEAKRAELDSLMRAGWSIDSLGALGLADPHLLRLAELVRQRLAPPPAADPAWPDRP